MYRRSDNTDIANFIRICRTQKDFLQIICFFFIDISLINVHGFTEVNNSHHVNKTSWLLRLFVV